MGDLKALKARVEEGGVEQIIAAVDLSDLIGHAVYARNSVTSRSTFPFPGWGDLTVTQETLQWHGDLRQSGFLIHPSLAGLLS